MRLKALCDAAGLDCPVGAEECEIASVVSDSRRLERGDVFVALGGVHTDGHRYLSEAAARGCRFAVVDRAAEIPESFGMHLFRVADPRLALAELCRTQYGFPDRQMQMIGVTGTNGKTTVTHLLRDVLQKNGARCGVIGTVGCHWTRADGSTQREISADGMTTPDAESLYRILAEMAEDGVEYVLMEVSSHALALQKTAPIEFACAIFTNLTQDHLDFHKTMEAYAEAKSRLFAKAHLSVINLDSPYAERMIKSAGERILTTGIISDADYRATEIEAWQSGYRYRLSAQNLHLQMNCPLAGNFNVQNSMQAAVAALALGVDPDTVRKALATATGVRGRMEAVPLGNDAEFSVFIDYAHTPDALETLLRSARPLVGERGRLVVLFGCGGDRDRGKRPLMGAIADRLADLVIVTSDNSRSEEPDDIIAEILSGISSNEKTRVIRDRQTAIEFAVQNARAGDVILLAGKGHEEYEIRREGKFPFYEKKIVLAARARRKEREQRESGR